ncbi:hypothetical protein RUM43_009406 [Polyplax serrata]|uniref:Uncharacterized protein n=1 Tax=Polyplax serrata TaxID=468196 RepID=A0AAN8RUE0_POLSC
MVNEIEISSYKEVQSCWNERKREGGQNGMGELPKAGGQKGFVAQAKDKKKKKESEKTWDANFSKYLNKYIEKVLNGTKK